MAIDPEFEPGRFDGRAEHADELGGEGGQIGRLVGGLRPSRFDACEVEQGVDELEQTERVSIDRRERLAAQRPGRSLSTHPEHACHYP
jgi:hypothetical protein